jgi:hypothetical protein
LARELAIDQLARGPGEFTGTYPAGGTPLHIAAAFGRLETVEMLLAAGATRDKVDTLGRSPNDVACAHFLRSYMSDEADRCKRLHAILSGSAGP